MIIKKGTKHPITRSDKPNDNWLEDDSYIVINDDSDLGKKVLESAPYFEWVYEGDEIIDIIPTDRPPEPPPEPTEIEKLQQENIINMVAMTEMYEENLRLEQENINTMVALTELYELMM